MRQIIMKAVAFSFAIVLLITSMQDSEISAEADKLVNENFTENTVQAEFTLSDEIAVPIILQKAVYSGKLEMSVTNLSSFDPNVDFEIELNGSLARTQSASLVKTLGSLFTTMDSNGYLEPCTEYTARVRAVTDDAVSEWSQPLTLYTNSKTYYSAEEGTEFFKLEDGEMISMGKLPQTVYAHAVMTDKKGDNCDGKNVETHNAKYIKFTDGGYEDRFIRVSETSRMKNSEVMEQKPESPEPELVNAFADELSVRLANLESYDPETVFDISVDGGYVKSVSFAELSEQGSVAVTNSATGYLAADTRYTITVEAQYRQIRTRTYKTFATGSVSYYKYRLGEKYYILSGGEFICMGLASSAGCGKGVCTDENGELIAGKELKSENKKYIKITEGALAGYYLDAENVSRSTAEEFAENERIRKEEEARRAAEAERAAQAEAQRRAEAEAKRKAEQAAAQKKAEEEAQQAVQNTAPSDTALSDRDAKIAKVCAYARSNSGGSYVFAGCNFRATDCSGLTMLSYRQIGVSLPHSAYSQAYCGKRVTLSEIQPGDLIITSNYGHVMIYVGGGEVVHAMNYSRGILTQKLSDALSWQYVNAVVRII